MADVVAGTKRCINAEGRWGRPVMLLYFPGTQSVQRVARKEL